VKGLLLALLFAVACSDPHGIVLWHAYNGAERAALEQTARTWNAAHPDQPLDLVAVPFDGFGDKLSSAIPRGNGPDLFIYPQDRIGDWADSNVIEPIEFWVDDARADRFRADAMGAMAYRGSLWGLPMTIKPLALYYRTDLVPTPPTTTDELLAYTKPMRAKDGYALAYANVDLYGHAAWLHGFGGRVMDNDGTLRIATPEAAEAAAFARDLVKVGAVPDDAQAPLVTSLFNEGRAAMAMSGPWFAADIRPGVPWKVATLPMISVTHQYAAPFASAEALVMSARAHDKDGAFAVMDFLTGDAAATTRAKLAHQVVPNPVAYRDPEVAADTTLATFVRQLEHSVPLPTAPAMRMVWTPYRTALGDVFAGRAEPGPRLIDTEKELEGYLRR
jgi:arabinogalactan oligomer/maltooligosaccharide transport system substrate-binding protein